MFVRAWPSSTTRHTSNVLALEWIKHADVGAAAIRVIAVEYALSIPLHELAVVVVAHARAVAVIFRVIEVAK